MRSFINGFASKITVKTAVIASFVFIALLWLIDFSPIGVAGLKELTGGIGILDYESRYTADYAYAFLESMTEAGRAFHLTRIMPFDIIYPPSLAFFMFSWLSLIIKKNSEDDSPARFILILPFIYLLLDYIENIGITSMLINYPVRLDSICVATGIVTSVKKAVVLLIIIMFIIQLALSVINMLKGGSHAKIKG